MFTAGAGSTRIDVRSVWFLLLYSSDFLSKLTAREREILLSGERDNDLLDALAEVLAGQVESRLRSSLVRRYRSRTQVLTRVRGRIDHLGTARKRLMDSGRILCRYEEQSVDLPRYRFMLVTLRSAAHQASSARIRRKCFTTAQMLERSGVLPVDPTANELSKEQYGHFDSADHKLILISRLVRDMCAPEHEPGKNELPAIARDEHALRRLFENAVRGFYKFHLRPVGYSVGGESKSWPAEGDPEFLSYLPRLEADVVIRNRDRQVVVECKFGPIYTFRQGKATINSNYLRQLYAYTRVFAQKYSGQTEALLLGALVDGSPGHDLELELDGMKLRVRQIDLSASPSEVRKSLIEASGVDEFVLTR